MHRIVPNLRKSKEMNQNLLKVELEERVIKRFCSKIIYNIFTGCWDWIGENYKGYGEFSYKGKTWRAHRFTYSFFRGELIKGMQLDHICCSPKCVNPYHLQQITIQEHAKITVQRRKDPNHHDKLVEPYLTTEIPIP